MTDLYDYDEPIRELGVDVPRWIDPEITGSTVAAILEGGCDSGAYMPAVTYHEALETMNEHGDEILGHIEDSLGEIPTPRDGIQSWALLATWFVSLAVELWASSIEGELLESLDR